MAPKVSKRNLKPGFISESDGKMRVIRRVKSPSGRVRVVSKRCGKKCNITFNSKIHTGTYKKRTTANYYPATKCSMRKVNGAKTKTGRKCVGNGRSTKNQIAARRAYNRKGASPKKANSPKKPQGMMARFANVVRRGGRVRKAPTRLGFE